MAQPIRQATRGCRLPGNPSRITSQMDTSKGDGTANSRLRVRCVSSRSLVGASGEEDVSKTAPSWPASLTSRSSDSWEGQCKNGDKKTTEPRADEKYPNRRNGTARERTPAHSERLPDIIQQFSWCDVIVIRGTRKSWRKSANEGEVKGTGVRKG